MDTQEYIVDNAIWVDKVRQIVPSDRVLGGSGEPANWQAEDLANRTKWLKAQYDSHTKRFVTVESNIQKAQTTADQAKTAASTADGKAVKAQQTADNAVTAAKTADSKAVTAQTTANQAKTAAATADGKAVAAQTTANQAKTAASTADGKAVKAQQTADSAVSAASAADSKAVAAQTTANQAKTAASTADGKAVAAQTTANQAKTAASTADGKAVKAQQTADSAATTAKAADTKAGTAQITANQAKTAAATADGKAVKAQKVADDALSEAKEKIPLGFSGLAGAIKVLSGDGKALGELTDGKSGFYANNSYNSGYERSYGIYLRHMGEYEAWLSWTYNATRMFLETTTPQGKYKIELLTDKNTTISKDGFLRAFGNKEVVTTDMIDGLFDVPASQLFFFDTKIVPSGYLELAGQAITQAKYPKLYAEYGARLPNRRDRYFRAAGGTRAGTAGTVQDDAIRNITGGFSGLPVWNTSEEQVTGVFKRTVKGTAASGPVPLSASIIDFDASRVVATSTENRPYSVSVLVCVKAQ